MTSTRASDYTGCGSDSHCELSAKRPEPWYPTVTSHNRNRLSQVLSALVTLVLVASAATVAAVSVMRLKADVPASRSSQSAAPRDVKDWRRLALLGTALDDRPATDTIVLISDYQCPFCRKADSIVNVARGVAAGGVYVSILHLPIEVLHPHARASAIAAECASRQSAFEAYHTRLFALQDSIGRVSFDSIARQVGVRDLGAFSRCLSEPSVAARVSRHSQEVAALEVTGTPAVIIQGRLYVGPSPDQLFQKLTMGVRP